MFYQAHAEVLRLRICAGTPWTPGKHCQSHCGGHSNQKRPQTRYAICTLICVHPAYCRSHEHCHAQTVLTLCSHQQLTASICVTMQILLEQCGGVLISVLALFMDAVVPTTTPLLPTSSAVPLVTTRQPVSTTPLLASTVPSTTLIVPTSTPGGRVPSQSDVTYHIPFLRISHSGYSVLPSAL